jgi:hypothetical protein
MYAHKHTIFDSASQIQHSLNVRDTNTHKHTERERERETLTKNIFCLLQLCGRHGAMGTVKREGVERERERNREGEGGRILD